MKKLFLMMVMAAMSSMAFAYDFPIDENGNCVVKKSIPTSKSEADAYMAAKSWLNSQGFTQMNANSDVPNKSFSYNLTMNTKSSYNPFAGQFVENLVFTISFSTAGGNANVKIENIQIQEIYGGFGVSNKINPITMKITELENAKKAVADAEANESLSKKEKKKIKKDNEDIIEDNTETLEKASEELYKRLGALEALLK
ncbi:MAG: hypothetical protein J6W56_05545 [Prevotella sp.]|nr:hypothetical protein [Prevotella sp.]